MRIFYLQKSGFYVIPNLLELGISWVIYDIKIV